MAKKKNKAEKRRKALLFAKKTTSKKQKEKEQSQRSRYRISGSVALPNIEEEKLKEIANNSYVLVFANYNHKSCRLLDINNSGQSKGLIALLDKMTKVSPKNKTTIIRDIIKKKEAKGKYLNLFSRLSEDIDELFESSFSGEGRVFFFTTDRIEKNYLNVVSIKPIHM